MENKCPYCRKYFKSKRQNQLYCEARHGWTHRNVLKTSTNAEEVKLQLGLLHNLKKLCKFSFSSCVFVDKERFASSQLETDYLKPIKRPENKSGTDSLSKWFEVHGYIINLHATGGCTLCEPSFFRI